MSDTLVVVLGPRVHEGLFPNVIYVVEHKLGLPPRLKFSMYFNFLLYIQ